MINPMIHGYASVIFQSTHLEYPGIYNSVSAMAADAFISWVAM